MATATLRPGRVAPKLVRRRARLAAPLPQDPARVAETRIDVEQLAARWRIALDAADGALQAARESLSPDAISEHGRMLADERVATLVMLKALAREQATTTRYLHLTPKRDLRRVLGLPSHVVGCVFELDGVLVPSARLHVTAWQQTFDPFLWRWSELTGREISPFRPREDYAEHMHGKPRLEGVGEFLASRGIGLPVGRPDDGPDADTVHGLANRKNQVLVRLIEARGVQAYADSVHYLETGVEAGMHIAVVSASANARRILERAGLTRLVGSCVDGNTMLAEHLRKRPAPDVLLSACRQLNVVPADAAAFETTPTGVAAAREALFGFVVGVDRKGQPDALRAAGADVVVPDLGEFLEGRPAA